MQCRRFRTGELSFYDISLSLTETEARDVRRALIFGLDVMRKQIEDGSAEFKAGTYVACERCVCEMAEAIDQPAKLARMANA